MEVRTGTCLIILDLFSSIIPTQSSNPTMYLPKFSPVCAPDKALNPITSDLYFHSCPFTSIQWAVIPRNPIFVMSADMHPQLLKSFLELPTHEISGKLLLHTIHAVAYHYV